MPKVTVWPGTIDSEDKDLKIEEDDDITMKKTESIMDLSDIKKPHHSEALYYDMEGEKLLVIFNNRTFNHHSDYYRNLMPSVRHGSDIDVENLRNTFMDLGFNIILHNDLNYFSLLNEVDKLRKKDMSSSSLLCVAIMTHGSSGGKLFAADRPYDISDVLTPFLNHPGLAGKPKLFFIQASRGDMTSRGSKVQTDAPSYESSTYIPLQADCLIMRSSAEGFLSFRDSERGSWFIQELCAALRKYHKNQDILHVVTQVQRAVVHNYKFVGYENDDRCIQQIPETLFTLTKLLKF